MFRYCRCKRARAPSNLARLVAGLGFLTAMTAHGQHAPDDLMLVPSNTPAVAGLSNDCGLRAVAFVLAEKGVHAEVEGIADLLSFRYAATGGRPIGGGYSLSDLQWILRDFGFQSRGLLTSRLWLQRVEQSAILRLPGKVWGHFVVLQSIDLLGMATIYDPSQGIIEIPLDILASRWANASGQGIALVTEGRAPTFRDAAN